MKTKKTFSQIKVGDTLYYAVFGTQQTGEVIVTSKRYFSARYRIGVSSDVQIVGNAGKPVYETNMFACNAADTSSGMYYIDKNEMIQAEIEYLQNSNKRNTETIEALSKNISFAKERIHQLKRELKKQKS